MINSCKLEEALEKIPRLDLCPWYILPGVERELIDELRWGPEIASATSLDQAGKDLDIEQPARHKRLLKQRTHKQGCAEKFSTALGVIDRQSQGQGGRGGENPAQIVSVGRAINEPTEEANSGPEDHLQVRMRLQDFAKVGDRFQRSSEIGVPVTSKVGVSVKGVEEPLPYRFSFADIPRQVKKCKAMGIILMQSFYHLQGCIGAAIVHKYETVGKSCGGICLKLVDVKPIGFIVTRDLNDQFQVLLTQAINFGNACRSIPLLRSAAMNDGYAGCMKYLTHKEYELQRTAMLPAATH